MLRQCFLFQTCFNRLLLRPFTYPPLYTRTLKESCINFYDSSAKLTRKFAPGDQLRSSYPHLKFFSSEYVDGFVKELSDAERASLLNELQKYQVSSQSDESSPQTREATITRKQMKLLFIFNCAPFIGFGFLDNAIMIVAGEYIDFTIGAALGISTMAAAAFGNLISDLCGIGLAGYVEVLCGKAGLPVPELTAQQMDLNITRFITNLGKAIGIAIGCLIGMFPLLFITEKHENEKDAA